ncbi:MAG: response regulator [candidate division Zixibacteria bacterium]|nr:response regulator transcription factor [candidate division Zixibacteria bacterium]NIW43982.1 response regulator [Gammaproteobacteria bacterium]NIR63057.1 response regulator transcription factor [candidate division Zixibacteria bacterium]NIS45069.1 response regulator transcription factor [candidate division Zixibacteria bacterium]NIU13178.1 response regulator transcription factor [candidate division Zixibacteria bacterium]
MPDIRVLIADDHPVVRKGIADILEPSVGITVVGEASNGKQALELIDELQPDVLLLDMELPDMSGVDVITQMAEKRDQVRILGLSSYDDREYISELFSLGASGYLIKDEAPELIVEAVRGVARGETGWVSRKVAALLTKIMKEEEAGDDSLTERELQVLSKVVSGKTNAEIGLILGISPKTVEKHLDSVYRKMGVASRVEAAVQAVRDQLI